jgi:hypothetical protein
LVRSSDGPHRRECIDEARTEFAVTALGAEVLRGSHQDATDFCGLERGLAFDQQGCNPAHLRCGGRRAGREL